MKEIVCFANRSLGAQVVSDLAMTPGVHVSVVVVNDDPFNSLPAEELPVAIPSMPWSRFLDLSTTTSGSQPKRFDAGVSVLFRHIIPTHILDVFRQGIVNLHPSFLPYGRGAYPATWALWDEEPYGASIHLMEPSIDTGPILAQERVEVQNSDTSETLYGKGLDALLRLSRAHLPQWLSASGTTYGKQADGGSYHRVSDLHRLRRLASSGGLTTADQSRLLRALSTGTVPNANSARSDLGHSSTTRQVSNWEERA